MDYECVTICNIARLAQCVIFLFADRYHILIFCLNITFKFLLRFSFGDMYSIQFKYVSILVVLCPNHTQTTLVHLDFWNADCLVIARIRGELLLTTSMGNSKTRGARRRLNEERLVVLRSQFNALFVFHKFLACWT